MNSEEIRELQERCYNISNSRLPLIEFFNDICLNDNPKFNKDLAYQDLKLIVDEIYRLKKIENQTKTPTIKEVIKEWEELGYEMVRNERLHFIFEKGDTYFSAWNYANVSYEKYAYGYSQKITFDEHQLLTKTFRALGWEVNK